MAPDELTPEVKEEARKIFRGEVPDNSACMFCGGIHARVANLEPKWQPCPRIKRIERHADGSILTVEFWDPVGNWDENVVFPWDVYDE